MNIVKEAPFKIEFPYLKNSLQIFVVKFLML